MLSLVDDLDIGPIRDIGLLDSAAHRSQVTVFGADAYPGLDTKAAVLLESLVRNQALADGNKTSGSGGWRTWCSTASTASPSKHRTTTRTTWSSQSRAEPPRTSRRLTSWRNGTSLSRSSVDVPDRSHERLGVGSTRRTGVAMLSHHDQRLVICEWIAAGVPAGCCPVDRHRAPLAQPEDRRSG